jgi:hypothetical protein
MRSILFLLIFLVLTLEYPLSYAQEMTYKVTYPEIKEASFTSNAPESNEDDLGTQLIVYSLIIGIYSLYWFKQKV